MRLFLFLLDLLFGSQTVYRVGPGGSYCLVAYRKQGYY